MLEKHRPKNKTIGLISAMALALGLSQTPAIAANDSDNSTQQKLQSVLAGEHRSQANKERDQQRHPLETLMFLGITPSMSVAEVSPGGGWYTEILAPFLRDQGTYYAVGYDPNSERDYYRQSAKNFNDKLQANPELYGKTKVTIFDPNTGVDIAPEGSLDMVLTFRNMHGWVRDKIHVKALKQMYKALKPGGVMGVVQHSLAAGVKQDKDKMTGYLDEDQVIQQAEVVGFKLVEKSDINANPKDTTDYAQGVWTLPPSLRLGEQDKEKYLSIGESNRMTLKFIKPYTK